LGGLEIRRVAVGPWKDYVRQLVIDNPVINSAFTEPAKHCKFTDDGITDEIVELRRPSANFIPVAQLMKKGRQLEVGIEWNDDWLREDDPTPMGFARRCVTGARATTQA
jgi:hypothetical protein